MNEKPESEKFGCVPIGCGAIVFLVFVPALYMLSIGPMCWLSIHEYVSDDNALLRAFYWPLAAAARNSKQFADLLKWYIELFVR